MESPSPLSGWVTLEQAPLPREPPFLHLSNGAAGVSVREAKAAWWWGGHSLHVRCLVSAPLFPPQTLPLRPLLPLEGVG